MRARLSIRSSISSSTHPDYALSEGMIRPLIEFCNGKFGSPDVYNIVTHVRLCLTYVLLQTRESIERMPRCTKHWASAHPIAPFAATEVT